MSAGWPTTPWHRRRTHIFFVSVFLAMSAVLSVPQKPWFLRLLRKGAKTNLSPPWRQPHRGETTRFLSAVGSIRRWRSSGRRPFMPASTPACPTRRLSGAPALALWQRAAYNVGLSTRKREQPLISPKAGRFATTRWSLVLEAGQRSSPKATEALPTLCETYWRPLYAYVRQRGHSVDDAQDLTQEFFVRHLDKQTLHVADPERGRFRSFLLASLKNFLTNEWRRDAAQKRGGERSAISLDFDEGESRYRLEPSHTQTPERIFERQWALTLLDRALTKLRAEFDAAGKTEHFGRLKVFLGGSKSTVPYRELGRQLDMSEGAVKVAVHRMRRRYRALLREEIQHTVAAPEDVDKELSQLFDILAS